MIGLRVNNEWLELKSPEISVVERGIIQDADDDFGSFTYPFNLLASPKNDKILKHSRLPNSIIEDKLISAELHINGTLYALGILKLIEADRSGYRCSFLFMPFAPEFLDKKLSEIFTDTFFTCPEYDDFLSLVGTAMINPDLWEKGNTDPEDNCRLPMWWNPFFYSESPSTTTPNDEYQELVNWFDKDTVLPVDNTIENEGMDFPTGFMIYPTHNRNVFVPCFFAGYILEKIMNAAALSFDGDFIEDARTKRLLVYNNAAMDNFKFPGYMRLMEENFSFPAGNITQSMAVVESHRNRLQNGTYLPTEWGYKCGFKGSYIFTIKIKFSVPVSQDYRLVLRFKENIGGAMTYPYEIIDTTVTITGDTYENNLSWDGFITGDFIEFDFVPVTPSPDAEKIEIEIFAPAYKESLGGGLFTYHLYEKLNIAPPTNKVSRHMPDVSVREFLQGLKKIFNLKIEPSKTKPHISLNFVSSKLDKLPATDLSHLALENPIVSFRDTREFLLQYNHGSDLRGANFAPPVGNLKGNNVVTIPAGVPEMTPLSSGNLDGKHRMFNVIEKGRSSIELGGDSLIAIPTPYRVVGPIVNESDADSTAALKFVSWFGVDSGSDYNYATSDDYLPDGSTVDNSIYNLRTPRILQDFWQRYLNAVNSNQSLRYGFLPDGFVLDKIDKYSLYRVAWSVFLLEELSYVITQSGRLRDVEIKGLKQ